MNSTILSDIFNTVNDLSALNAGDSAAHEKLDCLCAQLEHVNNVFIKFSNLSEAAIHACDYHTGEILTANEKYADYRGTMIDKLLGSRCRNLDEKNAGDFCLCPALSGKSLIDDGGKPCGPYEWEEYFPLTDMWFKITCEAIYWVDGRLAKVVTHLDITESKRAQDRLAQLALFYDNSMQLPNLARLERDLLESPPREGTYLLPFDIVALRKINSAYGRATGDLLLREIVDWILSLDVENFTVYRIGGDEFCLLVRDVPPVIVGKLARILFSRFDEAWSLKLQAGAIQVFCGVKLGIIDLFVNYSPDKTLSLLIERTLEFSRENSNVAIYDEALALEASNDILLEMSLASCVRDKMLGFSVYYQPIVNPVSGMWAGLEALCRWKSPLFGDVPPLSFISKAERIGLIGQIGEWVLETSVEQCKKWRLDENETFLLDVNLSPLQLTDSLLDEKVADILNKHNYPFNKLSLEITESSEFNFETSNIDVIMKLRELGIKITLDDFGTGYSSFNSLKNLPVSILKTEQAFIEGIETDNYLEYLSRAIINLAHAAEMRLIAEGVENEQQMKILFENGADLLQGFYFSEPLSAEELEKNLDKFSHPLPDFNRILNEDITMERLLGPQCYCTLSPPLYRFCLKCIEILMTGKDPEKDINEVFGLVGDHIGLARAGIFTQDVTGVLSLRSEWAADNINPLKTRSLRGDFLHRNLDIVEALKRDGIAASSSTDNLPDEITCVLTPHSPRAYAFLPLKRGNEIFGVSFFVNRDEHRNWSYEELLLLHNLSMALESICSRSRPA